MISHRGNIEGPTPELENTQPYLDKAIKDGYDVEADCWFLYNQWWLGHDEPKHKITLNWIDKNKWSLWLHCKNVEALCEFSKNYSNLSISSPNYFWHQNDDVTLTSHNWLWTFPNKKLTSQSVCVLPELGYDEGIKKCYGICTDYVLEYKINRHLIQVGLY